MKNTSDEEPSSRETQFESRLVGEVSYAQEATVLLSQQLQRAINALIVPGGNPLAELKEVDRLFEEAGESAHNFIDTTARRLLQQSDMLNHLAFQDSLIKNQSSFFGRVLRRMGELASEQPEQAGEMALPIQIRLVEHHRRSGNLDEMSKFSTLVEGQLSERAERGDHLACQQLAKVRYEESRADFDAKKYAEAILKAEKSGELAEKADDFFGVVAARSYTGAQARYTWAESLGEDHDDFHRLLDEASAILAADLQPVQEKLIAAKPHSNEWNNFARAEMNIAMHLMQIARLRKALESAREAWNLLEGNSVFQSIAGENYCQVYPQIVKDLEQLEGKV